jgi:hypothetical protein
MEEEGQATFKNNWSLKELFESSDPMKDSFSSPTQLELFPCI